MDAADYLIGAGYSRGEVLAMTPREIMYAVLPAMDRQDARTADQLVITALGSNDPKKAVEESEKLR